VSRTVKGGVQGKSGQQTSGSSKNESGKEVRFMKLRPSESNELTDGSIQCESFSQKTAVHLGGDMWNNACHGVCVCVCGS
jgi:hypothetical protein